MSPPNETPWIDESAFRIDIHKERGLITAPDEYGAGAGAAKGLASSEDQYAGDREIPGEVKLFRAVLLRVLRDAFIAGPAELLGYSIDGRDPSELARNVALARERALAWLTESRFRRHCEVVCLAAGLDPEMVRDRCLAIMRGGLPESIEAMTANRRQGGKVRAATLKRRERHLAVLEAHCRATGQNIPYTNILYTEDFG